MPNIFPVDKLQDRLFPYTVLRWCYARVWFSTKIRCTVYGMSKKGASPGRRVQIVTKYVSLKDFFQMRLTGDFSKITSREINEIEQAVK